MASRTSDTALAQVLPASRTSRPMRRGMSACSASAACSSAAARAVGGVAAQAGAAALAIVSACSTSATVARRTWPTMSRRSAGLRMGDAPSPNWGEGWGEGPAVAGREAVGPHPSPPPAGEGEEPSPRPSPASGRGSGFGIESGVSAFWTGAGSNDFDSATSVCSSARSIPAELRRAAPYSAPGSGMRGCGAPTGCSRSTSATGSSMSASSGTALSAIRLTNDVFAPFSSSRRTR